MAAFTATPAALLFTRQELGGPVNEVEANPTAQTTVASLINGDGDRVGLVIINLGANPVFVGLSSQVSSTNGILLAANGGLVTMNVRDDFTLPSRNWWFVSTGGASQCYTLSLERFTQTQQA